MIEQKSIKDVTADMRTNYQTAKGAFDKNNLDYAILLLKGIIKKDPGFMEVRNLLRQVEKKKLSTAGFLAKTTGNLKAGGIATKGKAMLVAKKPEQAMKLAEDALAISISSLPALNLLAQAAIELEATFITIEALKIAIEYHPKNDTVMDWLANVYADEKEGVKALQVRQKIAAMDPKNMEKQQAVRSAAALATIEKGKFDNKEGDFRQSLKNQDQAVQLEQIDRIVRDVDDVKSLIDKYEEQIAKGDDSVDIHRKLAELYQKGGNHDDALKHFNHVVEKMGTLDPHIDQAIEKSTVANFEDTLKQWQEYGAADSANKEEADQNVSQIEKQSLDYRLARALARVELYPNDTELRFFLAMVYWEINNIDEALQQFQIAQKNPHRRLIALVYLGRCFHAKGQNDIAVEQFENAITGMVAMNKDKMDAIYHLAITYEAMGETEKAASSFKQIYQANVSFRDVAKRMENLYK